jgi:hypothetical protein
VQVLLFFPSMPMTAISGKSRLLSAESTFSSQILARVTNVEFPHAIQGSPTPVSSFPLPHACALCYLTRVSRSPPLDRIEVGFPCAAAPGSSIGHPNCPTSSFGGLDPPVEMAPTSTVVMLPCCHGESRSPSKQCKRIP